MKVLFILVLAAIVVMVFLRKRPSSGGEGVKSNSPRKQVKSSTARPAAPGGAFRSTSIECSEGACDAAKALRGTRFLFKEAPMVPLPNCTAAQCDCKYSHHQDRREPTGDRRAISGLSTELYADSGKAERRGDSRPRGRRNKDQAK